MNKLVDQYNNTCHCSISKTPGHSHCSELNRSFVYEIDAWPKIPSNNLKLRNCLFGVANLVKMLLKT